IARIFHVTGAEAPRSGLAARVLDRTDDLDVPRQGGEPGQLDAEPSAPLAAEDAADGERLIDEIPAVWVGRVDATEAVQKLSEARLEASRQGERRAVGLLDLDPE